jgi:hypothetical protein
MDEINKVKQHVRRVRRWAFKPVLDDCPVCGAKDQETDIIAHGPGVGILGYACGCRVSSKDGRATKYIKYDGTIIGKPYVKQHNL